jgi:pimeloyl-ACP methyl ester carboxylesterase
MAHQIPNTHLVIIPGAPHLANLEQPDAFNQIVVAFASALGKGKQS